MFVLGIGAKGHTAANCRYEKDKFGAAGLHPLASELVRPPRVAECPVQIEARVADLRLDSADDFVIAEAATLRVRARRSAARHRRHVAHRHAGVEPARPQLPPLLRAGPATGQGAPGRVLIFGGRFRQDSPTS